jgi:hypothetical protein
MKRRLLAFLSHATLLLSAAACVLWARSYRTTQFVGWGDPNQFVGALSMGGLIRLEHGTYAAAGLGWGYVSYPTPDDTPPGLWGELAARDRRGGALRRVGVAYARIDYLADGTQVRRALYLPHWLLAAVLAVLPAAWARRAWRRRGARRPGHCRTCGYDLRASPDRCPECGTPAGPAATTTAAAVPPPRVRA